MPSYPLLNSALRAEPDTSEGAPVKRIDAVASYIRIYTGRNGLEGEIRLPVNENWYEAALGGPYSGPGYEKPGAVKYIKIAEIILSKIPQAQIYYGDDEHSLTPFVKKERDELRALADGLGDS
jgi:hypothetical protein